MTGTESIGQAQALYRAGDGERAKAIAEDILRSDPTDADALQLIEDVAFSSGDFADAIGWFSAAIAMKREYSGLQDRLGCLLEAQGDLPEALAAYLAALRVDPRRKLHAR